LSQDLEPLQVVRDQKRTKYPGFSDDPERKPMIIFGGVGPFAEQTYPRNDVWEWHLSGLLIGRPHRGTCTRPRCRYYRGSPPDRPTGCARRLRCRC
jgi:hypothetical protein